MEGYKRPASNQSEEGPNKRPAINPEDFGEDLDEDDYQLQQGGGDVDIQLGEAGRNWERPPVGDFNPIKSSLGEFHFGRGTTAVKFENLLTMQFGKLSLYDETCPAPHSLFQPKSFMRVLRTRPQIKITHTCGAWFQ